MIRKICLAILITALTHPLITSDVHAQAFSWAKSMGGIYGDLGGSVAIDGDGNVISTGVFSSDVDFDPGPGVFIIPGAGQGLFIQKLDSSGNFLWAKSVNDGSDCIGNDVAIDAAGNIWVTGHFSDIPDFDPGPGVFTIGASGPWDIFILKLDPAGEFIWAGSFTGPAEDRGVSIAVDPAGNIACGGYFGGTVDVDPGPAVNYITSNGGSDAVLVKLSEAGSFLWAYHFGAVAIDKVSSVAIDESSNIYLTGNTSATSDFDPGPDSLLITTTNPGMYIVKLSPTGNLIWAQTSEVATQTGISLTVNEFGKVYITGTYVGYVDLDPGAGAHYLTAIGQSDAYIIGLDTAGTFLWAKNIGGLEIEQSYGITTDNDGNVYSTGYFETTVNFDPGVTNYSATVVAEQDIYIIVLDPSGNFQWARTFGGVYYDRSSAIACDNWNNIYTFGVFSNTVDFSPGLGVYNLVSNGSYDYFIQKLSPGPIAIQESSIPDHYEVFPNPGPGEITIQSGESESGVWIEVSDATGRIVLIKKIDRLGNHVMVIPGPAGMYFVTFKDENGLITTKKIIKT